MAKEEGSHSEMAQARWSDGINVIFDQNSPASLRSCSRSSSHGGSSSSHSSESDQHRPLGHRRRHYRSSSTSSSSRSRSAPRTRSRSRPRCNRPSSRCRCDNHPRYHRVNRRRSPAHRARAHSRPVSRSPPPDRHSHRRRTESRSSSNSHSNRNRRTVGRFQSRVSQSPVNSYRSRSRSGSSGSSLSLSMEDKQQLLVATKSLNVEHLPLPESNKTLLLEEIQSQRLSSKPRVRQDPEKTASQSREAESDHISNPKSPPRRKEISFSINNSVAKPIVTAPSTGKVTSRVDSFGRRKPYGHWVPVKSRHFC